eukprot:TRINITY_DN13357_c0_g1_i1.p1 TRINITY_DN13357_c0_g1~~TRINITY_DN13357_c0_g1_i1.p1  ORF type:complete len:118 (-),score=7.09 TRINITY_DN13357_c0_g1_i1:17-370(-)
MKTYLYALQSQSQRRCHGRASFTFDFQAAPAVLQLLHAPSSGFRQRLRQGFPKWPLRLTRLASLLGVDCMCVRVRCGVYHSSFHAARSRALPQGVGIASIQQVYPHGSPVARAARGE